MGKAPPRHKEAIKTLDRTAAPPRNPAMNPDPTAPRLPAIMMAVVAVAVTAALGQVMHTLLPSGSLALLFLLAVLVISVGYGFWTGLAAALLSFLAYNFLFVEPLYTLRVADAKDVLALAVFLAAAGTTGFLAGRLREEADAARARAAQMEVTASFSSSLADCVSAGDVAGQLVQHLAAMDGGEAVFLRADGDSLTPVFQAGRAALDAADLHAAERALRRNVEEAATAAGWSGSRYTFRPFAGGVIGHRAATSRTHDFFTTLLAQADGALERLRLAGAAREAQAAAEREELRATLLASLSHDLRTPLATILGGVTGLRELGERMEPGARADLLGAVEEETRRLSRYVENLLQLTRLNAGMALRTDWCDPADIMQGAVARARAAWPQRHVRLAPPGTLRLLRGDAVLLEQALFNLLDNALRYSGAGADVLLSLDEAAESATFTVRDNGPGFSDAGGHGGLGLAIVRGIAAAHGGRLRTESLLADGRGTAMHLTLPAAPPVQEAAS